MSSVDLIIDEQDEEIAHSWTFCLWPKKWTTYDLPDPFNWEIHPFHRDQIDNIPNEPGIYSFVIQPGIASHPHCSYLMYIGQTERALRVRFREYLYERRNLRGRRRILRLLNKYQGYLYFCCSTIAKTEQIVEIEKALRIAFRPPCNSDSTSAHPGIGAF